jgi:NAD kinase
MKVAIVGRRTQALEDRLVAHGLKLVEVEAGPDLIVTHGGDGTLIGAEREWPGIPKLAFRDGESTVKCERHDDDDILARLVRGQLKATELMKVTAEVGSRELRGVNDVILRNRDVRSSVRFAVSVNGEAVSDENIGDGLVIATPFGSSAYFRSITHATIRCGIGVAFNNCTEFVNHLVLAEDDVIQVRIVRGPAEVCADNDPDVLAVEAGDEILVRRSTKRAIVLGVDALRCGSCRYANAPRRRF